MNIPNASAPGPKKLQKLMPEFFSRGISLAFGRFGFGI
jgi:hypothetical protein